MSTYSINRPQFIDRIQGIKGFLSELAATLWLPSALDESIASDCGAVAERHLIDQVREHRESLFSLLRRHGFPLNDINERRHVVQTFANTLICDHQACMGLIAQSASRSHVAQRVDRQIHSMLYYHQRVLGLDALEAHQYARHVLLANHELFSELLGASSGSSPYGAYRDHSRFISLLFSFEVVGQDVGSFYSNLSTVPLRTDLIQFMNEQSVALMARLKEVSITYYRTARKVRQELDALGEPGLDLLLS